MAFFFPSAIMSIREAETIAKTPLQFNQQGYLHDPELRIQKALEDNVGQPIMIVQMTTQKTINILMDPYGVVQNNYVSNHRLAMLKGDCTYLKSTLDMMIKMHPNVSPQTIVSSYSYQCAPQDKIALKQYLKDKYQCY